MFTADEIHNHHKNGKVTIGSFGVFIAKYITDENAKWLTETWLTLEKICYQNDRYIGIYSNYDLLRYGLDKEILTQEGYEQIFNLLAFSLNAKKV